MLDVADIIIKVSRLMISKRKYLNSFPALGIFFFVLLGRNGIFLNKNSSTIFIAKKTKMNNVSKLLFKSLRKCQRNQTN